MLQETSHSSVLRSHQQEDESFHPTVWIFNYPTNSYYSNLFSMSDGQVRFNFKRNSARKKKKELLRIHCALWLLSSLLVLGCCHYSIIQDSWTLDSRSPKQGLSLVGSLLCMGSKLSIFIVASGYLAILSASIHCDSLSWRHEQEYFFSY